MDSDKNTRHSEFPEPKQMKKRHLLPFVFRIKRTLLHVTILLAAIAVIFTAGTMYGRNVQQNSTAVTSDLISQRLNQISELACVEYNYTNMGKFENQVDFYGWKVPLTKKSFILSYNGCIKAGIRTSSIKTSVTAHQISVTLPPAEILSHEIDDNSLQIFDEQNNLFNAIKISDYTGFSADQKSAIETRAIQNGLLLRAQKEAETTVRQFLSFLPESETKTVIITSKSPS